MSESNKQVVRNYMESYAAGELDMSGYAEDALIHGLLDGYAGSNGLYQLASMVRNAFTEVEQTIDLIMAEGDYVTMRATIENTHTGDIFDMPASGVRFSSEHIHIYRFENGKIVERWNQNNMFQQLQDALASS